MWDPFLPIEVNGSTDWAVDRRQVIQITLSEADIIALHDALLQHYHDRIERLERKVGGD